MINLIASVINYKNKLIIGANGDLVLKLSEDMKFFKNITMNSLSNNSALDFNVVIMGKKTFFSIEPRYRPLEGRLNLVLTRDKNLASKLPENINDINLNEPYFINMKLFKQFYKRYNPNVFVIGGGDIYKLFLEGEEELKPERMYITEVHNFSVPDITNLTVMPNFDETYEIVGYSNKMFHKTRPCTKGTKSSGIEYRVLFYRRTKKKSDEHKYLDLVRQIFTNGNKRDDRTGTGTISIFGSQLRFDISNGKLPLLTTKFVSFNTILEELLWFCRGDTDAKILQAKGIKIWDGNTSREFLDKCNLDYPEGVLGAGYGWQIRHQGAEYNHMYADSSKVDFKSIGGFDQLAYIEHLLKTDPYSRRIMMSYWNPSDFSKTALQPCHYSIQFYVEEINGIKYLSSHFTMRSNDLFLGNPYNIASYATLTYILAARCGMKPKELIYTGGDCHIYKNHLEAVKKQLERDPRSKPILILNESIKNKDWSEMLGCDFEVWGYFPYPSIKAPMAV
jgi:dihydrofolate reductase / thymidylate synthase